jgi:hypothetical protein
LTLQCILIKDERVGELAQRKQPLPIDEVTRQRSHFKAEYNADAIQADFAHQALEALSVSRTYVGHAAGDFYPEWYPSCALETEFRRVQLQRTSILCSKFGVNGAAICFLPFPEIRAQAGTIALDL